MKMSKMAITTQKERSNSLECKSQKYFLRAGMLFRYGAGIYALDNMLFKALERVNNIIRFVLEKYDCVEVQLPIIQPKSIWEESGRWENYVSGGKTFYSNMENGSFVFAPTAEEAMLTFVKSKVRSYKDLPVNFYQIGTKFRNELRSRGGLLRSKEFLMMDSYSFHSSEDSLKEEYEKMKKAYMEIFSILGLHAIPVGALNGDMGGNVSEEFMIISDAGEDAIFVNEEKNIAFNKEIFEEHPTEEILEMYNLPNLDGFVQRKGIELGHIFQLGTKYSQTMNGTFKDNAGNEKPFYMGCYGIGVSRVLAAVCEQFCDEFGLCWPENVAPYQVMIIYNSEKEKEAKFLYDQLLQNNIHTLIDDRNGLSFGSRIFDWKLLGIPYAIILGNRYQPNKYEVEKRANGEKSVESLESLLSKLRGEFK